MVEVLGWFDDFENIDIGSKKIDIIDIVFPTKITPLRMGHCGHTFNEIKIIN